MRKDYTIYINTRSIKASYKMFLCHNTMQFNGIQTEDVYSEFMREYIIPSQDLCPYMTTIASYDSTRILQRKLAECIEIGGIKPFLRRSILLSAWYASYFYNHDSLKKGPISINELIDSGINYSRLNLSSAYESLYPLTNFYKKLTIDIDMNRYYSPIYEKDYVTVEDIKKLIEPKGINFEDIKEDIEHHGILNPYKGNYIWGSKPIYNWLLDVDHSDLYRINLNKILSVEHNYLF